MPQELTQSLTTEKNKAANTPITLYEVYITEYNILRLAEWTANVEYPTGSGNIYSAFPIKHEGVTLNAMGEINAIKVTVGSVNGQIPSLLDAYNGLTDCKIILKLVFADLLDDVDANIPFTTWVDYVETNETECVFYLTSKVDLFQVQLPGRLFERDHCQWMFKNEGCWLLVDDVWTAPAGFVNGSVECDHTLDGRCGCKYHANGKRFGAFPGIPSRQIILV